MVKHALSVFVMVSIGGLLWTPCTSHATPPPAVATKGEQACLERLRAACGRVMADAADESVCDGAKLASYETDTLGERLENTCEEGQPAACLELARLTHDDDVAFARLEQACALGHPAACVWWANMSQSRAELECDHEPLVASCENGDYEACSRRAWFCGRSYKLVDSLHERACDAGVIASCLVLGDELDDNRSNAEGISRAEGLYRQLCEQDVALGCGRLGALLVLTGASSSDVTATYGRGCELGDAESCASLAVREPAREEEYSRRACELGDEETCAALAETAAATGDSALATELLIMACRLGHYQSCTGELGCYVFY